MEIKKNASLKLENKRIPFILIGLLFAGSMTLASFSYKKGTDRFVKEKNLSNITKIEYEMEEIKEVEPPKEEPTITYTPPPSEEIKEKENSNEITKTTVVVIPPDIKIDSVTVVVVEEKIIDFPDIEASFPGGFVEMSKWINKNVVYPDISLEMEEEGKVYVSFVIELDGSITDVKIDRSISRDLDREAKRLVRLMPKWVPGESKGEKVRTRCSLPINFELR
jgi:protein TonB